MAARIAPDTTRRLGRAAAFVFGATVALSGCGSEVSTSDNGGTGAGMTGQGGGGGTGGAMGQGGSFNVYGGPGGSDGVGGGGDGGAGGAGGAGEGGTGDGGNIQPPYGSPVPPDEPAPENE